MFTNADARAALDREKNVGFRCVKHLPGQGPPKETLGEAKPAWSDFLAIKPLSDREFLLVKGMYAYARRPLKDKVQRLEETSAWVHERVEVDAAYGNERLIVHLFLPRESAAPYQSVVYWPGTGALQARVIASPTHEGLAFLIKSGRALVWPIYKGTYERPLKPADKGLSSWDVWLQRAKDLSRAIDYLETRKDIDAGAIGYYGLSWGASGALRAVAVEERIKAAVLIDGGVFPVGPKNPEVNPVHYLPRITIPVLMLNGEYDHIFPRKQSQEPLFQLLGTDLARKKHVVFKSGHVATPMAERIQETVSWFDRYLGPVHRKASAHGSPTR
jgi:predicted esterase